MYALFSMNKMPLLNLCVVFMNIHGKFIFTEKLIWKRFSNGNDPFPGLFLLLSLCLYLPVLLGKEASLILLIGTPPDDFSKNK